MNYQRWINVSFLTISSLILIIEFQNCGVPPSAGSFSLSEEGKEVRVSDGWAKMKLSFVERPRVSVQNAREKIEFIGLCDTKDTRQIEWEVSSEGGSLKVGETVCQRGGFRVSIDPLSELDCGQDYYLTAVLGDESDEVVIYRQCLSSSKSFMDEDSPSDPNDEA